MNQTTALNRPAGARAPAFEFRQATRNLASVLAPLEKRCLLWLAARMPQRVNSDHLTGLALIAMMGAGLSFWLGGTTPAGLVLVVVCLAINWFGDSLDGTLARVRNHQRPRYGFYVDHVVDAIGITFLIGGMALSGFMNPLLAAGLLIAYFLVCVEVYLATNVIGVFNMSFFAVGPTELRIILSIGALALLWKPETVILGQAYKLFDVGGVVATAGLLFTFIYSALKNTRALYRAEPIPTDGGR